MKTNNSKNIIILAILSVLLVFNNYLIFIYAPTEKVMGHVQRIFYFHVGSAFASYLAIGFLFVSSVCLLSLKDSRWDHWARAAGEISLLFCTIVLLTGMIWGKAAWGTWFNWEPRLVSFLLLWLTCAAYVILREFSLAQNVAEQAAVLGIVSAVMVPIMIYSIKYLPIIQQLHPVVV
jgi:heme exporter protein C